MNMIDVAAAQDALNETLNAAVEQFKADNPDITLTGLNYEMWGEEPKFVSTVNVTIDGARISRNTQV